MLKNRFLLSVIGAYIVLALGYSLVIPLGEAPDEVSHFAYVQMLTLQHQLPGKEGAASGQAHQAPLYYVVSALLTSWIPQQDFAYLANPDWELNNPATPNLLLHTRTEAFPYRQAALAWHLVRLLSVVMGAITLVLSYGLARTLFPERETVARLAVAFMAFLPSFDFLTSTVNNDNLVVLLSVASLVFFLRKYRPHPSYPLGAEQGLFANSRDFVLGILLGLSLLSKFSAWALWLTLGLAILLGFSSGSLGQRVKSLLVIFGVALLVYSPWLLYNTLVYQDPLSWSRLMGSTPRLEPTTWQDWQVYAEHMFESFWGKLGGAGHLEIPRVLYWLLSLLVVSALVGWLWRLRRKQPSTAALGKRPALWVALTFVILLLASHLRLYTVLLGADQARQVFAALPVVAALVGAGLSSWWKRPSLDWLFASVMGLVSAGVLFFAATLYQPVIQTAEVAASATPPAADFDQQIRLLDYQVSSVQPGAGETLAITIRWQALADLSEDYWVLLKVDQQDTTVASHDSVPSAGLRTTDWWRKGEIYTSTHKLQLPSELAPGSYKLLLGMHPLGNWEWVKVDGQDVLKLSDLEVK